MTDACCSCEDVKKIIKATVGEIFDQKVEELKKIMSPTKGKRAKRAPSKYNIFIGECMKGDGKTMKQCAADYKKKKAAT